MAANEKKNWRVFNLNGMTLGNHSVIGMTENEIRHHLKNPRLMLSCRYMACEVREGNGRDVVIIAEKRNGKITTKRGEWL